MSKHDGDRPAFPHPPVDSERLQASLTNGANGLSAREHAAIQLRVPDSGTPWLDDMIREARRMDAAQALLASFDLAPDSGLAPQDYVHDALMLADALSALKQGGE